METLLDEALIWIDRYRESFIYLENVTKEKVFVSLLVYIWENIKKIKSKE